MPSFFMRIWPMLALLWGLTACAPVTDNGVQPLVQSREWRMDPTGQNTLADAEKASDWQAMPQLKTWGFGPETVWVRLHLRAADAAEDGPWVVRVLPAYLDRVTIYDTASGLTLRSGDALPQGGDDMSSIFFTFTIPALDQERSVYLKLRSSSARLLNTEVLPYAQAQRKNRLLEWMMGFIGSTSAIFALWALAQWAIGREKIILAFAVKQIFGTGYVVFLFGFARLAMGPSLPEGALSDMASVVLILTVISLFWFFSILLQDYQPWRPIYQVYRLAIALTFVLLPVPYLFPGHWALAAANWSLLLLFGLLILTVVTAFFRRKSSPIPITTLMVYLLLYSLPICLPSMMNLRLVEVQPLVFFSTLLNAVLDGVVMFVLLQYRARTIRLQQAQITDKLQRSQLEASERKRHLKEQSQLFSMLAHEIKTPLATLRMWMQLGPLEPKIIEEAITDMNLVVERCVHASQLAEQGLQPVLDEVDPNEITQEAIERCRFRDRLDWTPAASIGPLHTDPQMLSIVLTNLLENAGKYSPEGSRILLKLESATRDGQRVWRWEVRNQVGSSGFPDEDKLFEKYYRGMGARRISGSGLGLFLVKGLLGLLQGHIDYRRQGEQVVFSFWLPMRSDGC